MATAEPQMQLPHPTPEAEEVYRRWLRFLDDEFLRHCSPERRSEIVREQLTQLYLGRPAGGKLNLALTSELPGNVLTLALDPMNVTLEAEHYADVDRDRFARRKPLLWFWRMFDRSPIGLNHWLGIRFRCMLGRHIFEHMGSSVKIHHGIDITYGYNLWIGDNVVIRQHALFNDRGGIRIGSNAIIGSYARVYSQVHDSKHFEQVRLETTVIGERARIGSHAIVLAGQHVPDGTTIGSFPAEGR
jgi:acetyltransferase-like isoleucine patch superfamily enzyme